MSRRLANDVAFSGHIYNIMIIMGRDVKARFLFSSKEGQEWGVCVCGNGNNKVKNKEFPRIKTSTCMMSLNYLFS